MNELNITTAELKMTTKDIVDKSEVVEIKSDVAKIGNQVTGMVTSVNQIGVMESNMNKYVLYSPQFVTGQLKSHFGSGVIPFSKIDGSMNISGGKPTIVVPGLYSISFSIMKQYSRPHLRIDFIRIVPLAGRFR